MLWAEEVHTGACAGAAATSGGACCSCFLRAERIWLDRMDDEALKKMSKNKKLATKLAKHHILVVSEANNKQISHLRARGHLDKSALLGACTTRATHGNY
ncbi:hypothetical protein ACP70R_017805 [Stipagrostis hirtigluma subsp. patula]